MNKKKPLFSIIIPIYNESRRVNNLSKVYNYLKKERFRYEVILVNDGSNDDTLKKINNLKKRFKLISYPTNRGKGYAIKLGMLASKGDFCIFMDIDLSTPIEELNKIILYIEKYDVIICSRKTKGSKLRIKQSPLRENLGKGFTLLSQRFLNLDISDFTCGFKCFSRKAAKEIFIRQKIERWGFDSEILFIAKKLSYKVKEVPVNWSDSPESKVKFPQAIIDSFIDLLKIRYFDLKKEYS